MSNYPFPRKRMVHEFTSEMHKDPRKSHLAQSLLMSVILASFLMLIIRRLLHFTKQLEVLAMTDSLTDLPNQRALKAALDHELERAQRYNGDFAVLFLDIDYFKLINDIYGHPVGDTVLREFAGVVHSSLRRNDTMGRWGGDEFVVILRDTDEVGAQQLVERIHTMLARHLLIRESEFHLTCSIGSSTYPFTAQERELLITAADQAMYAAKCQAHKHKYPSPTINMLKPESSGFTQNMLEVTLR